MRVISEAAIPALFPVPAVARRLSVATSTVWAWIADGRLEVVRIGGRTLVRETAIEELIRRHTIPAR